MNYSPTGFRPAGTLSMIAIIGLALTAVCELLNAIIGVAEIVDPLRTLNLGDGPNQSVWLLSQGVIAIFQFPLYLGTAIAFLVWLYRAYTNLSPLQTQRQEFTPGWAVGWWFVPFANLVNPFKVMREVWFDSDPYVASDSSLFTSGPRTAPNWMGLWWGLWISSNVFSNFAGRFGDAEDLANIPTTGYLFIFAGGLSFTAAILCIKLVREVTTRQELRFANLLNMQRYSPPPPPSFM